MYWEGRVASLAMTSDLCPIVNDEVCTELCRIDSSVPAVLIQRRRSPRLPLHDIHPSSSPPCHSSITVIDANKRYFPTDATDPESTPAQGSR